MWTDVDLGISRAALWTKDAMPLPSVPLEEFKNMEAINTIFSNPHLFKIVTPINISRFKELHPNRPFVDSVIYGLSYGFWPFAHTHYDSYPITVNDSGAPPKTSEQTEFLRKQIQTESDADRYSAPFGPDLLQGMYSTPILAIPRKGKLCLCNYHSYGKFALNSMIDRDDIAGVKLDGIRELRESLHLFRHQHGSEPLVVFKSDVGCHFITYGKLNKLLLLKIFVVWTVRLVSAAGVLRLYSWLSWGLSRGSPSTYTLFLI